MSGFKFSPTTLDGVPLKPLGDKTLQDLVTAEATYDGGTEFDNITFTFDLSANGLIRACNSADDEDKEDGVLGVPPKEEPHWEVSMPVPLVFNAESAWLKYRFEGRAKGSVGAKFPVGPAGGEAKIEGQKGVVFADYRLHERDEQALAAVRADALAGLRAAFRADDALALGRGDALLYRVYGELSASVTLSWSDVFTASLNSLSALLRAGEVIALKVSPAAEVSFHVGLRDDFRLVFTKGEEADVRVSVLKAKSRELGVGVKLGVTAEFANPDAVSDVLTELYDGLAGPLVENVEALFAEVEQAASLDALPAEFREPARALMSRLGLDPLTDTLAELREKWDELKGKIPGIIEKVAKTKVEAGFTYEYLRVKTDETLLVAELSEDIFRRFHPDLMVCGLEGLTDWLREPANSGALRKYLRQRSVRRTTTWGFNLGISPWGFKVGGADTLEKGRVVQENIKGAQRMAYDGLRSYEGLWLGDTVTWAGDFKAEMKQFSVNAAPKTCEFEYGLGFKWEWDEKALDRDEFLNILDHAQLWQVVRPGRVEQALSALEERFGEGAKVQLELAADHEALVRLLPLIVNPPPPPHPPPHYDSFTSAEKLEYWGAEALAAAMPYMKMFDGRNDPGRRTRLYAPLWRDYFKEDSRSFSEYRDIAFFNIPRLADDPALGLSLKDDEGLAAHERVKEMRQSTFAGMIELHQGPGGSSAGVHRNWQSFARGLQKLEAAARPGNCLPHELIEKSFDEMARFWGQSFYLRAVGYFLAEMARRGGGARLLKRSLTVTYGEEEAIIIGS